MTSTDSRSVYVLAISMLGTVAGFAGVWITSLPIA